MPAMAYGLALLVMLVIVPADARAQNLDAGKSGATLFAASCATCHRSARGLAKGRMSFTLSYFLRQHYTSGPASAQTLTAYLQAMDTPRRARPKPAARKAKPTSAAASRLSTGSIGNERPLRPPARIPRR